MVGQVTAWVSRLDLPPAGDVLTGGRTRIAVKDAIDMVGEVTSAGSVAVRDRARRARKVFRRGTRVSVSEGG